MLKSWIQSDLGNRNITQPFRLLDLLPKKYLKTSLFCSLFIDAMIISTTVIRESNKCLIAVFVFLCWPDMREWGIMLTELLRMCECVQYCDITPPRHIIQWWIMPALLIRWDRSHKMRQQLSQTGDHSTLVEWYGKGGNILGYCFVLALLVGLSFLVILQINTFQTLPIITAC